MPLGDPQALHGDVAVLDPERIAIVWDSLGAEGSTILASVSADGGQTWSAPQRLSAQGDLATHPRVVASPWGFLALWTEQRPNGSRVWATASGDRALSPCSGVLCEWVPTTGGHRQFLSIKAADGRMLGEKMLDAKENFVTLVLPGTGTPASGIEEVKRDSADHPPNPFLAFLGLGVEHILTGYDHLLFLFALLVVVQGLWSSIKIITAFTVAYSLTLALATFNVVMIPGAIVEP